MKIIFPTAFLATTALSIPEQLADDVTPKIDEMVQFGAI